MFSAVTVTSLKVMSHNILFLPGLIQLGVGTRGLSWQLDHLYPNKASKTPQESEQENKSGRISVSPLKKTKG